MMMKMKMKMKKKKKSLRSECVVCLVMVMKLGQMGWDGLATRRVCVCVCVSIYTPSCIIHVSSSIYTSIIRFLFFFSPVDYLPRIARTAEHSTAQHSTSVHACATNPSCHLPTLPSSILSHLIPSSSERTGQDLETGQTKERKDKKKSKAQDHGKKKIPSTHAPDTDA